jgi:hypothetical protein
MEKSEEERELGGRGYAGGGGDDGTFVHYCIGWRSAWDRCHDVGRGYSV